MTTFKETLSIYSGDKLVGLVPIRPARNMHELREIAVGWLEVNAPEYLGTLIRMEVKPEETSHE